MSPLRRKARGGAGGKISLPPPSISPPLTCKILQERRALRKLFGPPDLADHPLKPSLLRARRVPINPKVMTQQKNVSRLLTAPSHKQGPGNPFKKPFYVGNGFSTSIMPCRGAGSVAEAFCAAARVRRNLYVDVGSKHTGKLDAAQARLSKALACCTLQIRTGEKHLTTRNCDTQKHADDEKENDPTQQNHMLPSAFEADKVAFMSNDFDTQVSHDVKPNEDDGKSHVNLQAPIWPGQLLSSFFKASFDKDQVSFASHSYATLQECDDARSTRNVGEKPRSHDDEPIFSPRSCGNEAIFDSPCVNDYACKFVSQVNAGLQASDDTRSRGNASEEPTSHCDQAIYESPWGDVDARGFASHSYADYQEIDYINNSGDAHMDKCEHHSIQKKLGVQVALSDISNELESCKDTKLSHTLQEKLALFEGTVSHIAANLKKTSDQLDTKIYDNVVLLSCIQSKLSSIEGIVTKMEAFNCKDLTITKSA